MKICAIQKLPSVPVVLKKGTGANTVKSNSGFMGKQINLKKRNISCLTCSTLLP